MAALDKVLAARGYALKGYTQRQIAEVMGVSVTQVGKLINATLEPHIEDELARRKDEPEEQVIEDIWDKYIGDIQKLKEYTLSEDARVQRSLELERLDSYVTELDYIIKNSKAVKHKMSAIKVSLQLQERRARYIGLDTPFKFEGLTQLGYVVDGVDMDKLR